MRTDYNPHSPFRDDADLIIPYKLPPEVPVVCVLTHLPDRGEYHKDRWDIVMASLTLARQNAGIDHHLLVWDNGSSPEFVAWLQAFDPDTLILSKNVGVANALRRVLGMFIDSVVSWCNDDLIYYPNWLQPQIDILKHFPNCATVSGCVTRFYTNKADNKTVEWARDNAKISTINTPTQWDIQHGASVGKKNVANMFVNTKIRHIEYNGVKALIGGNHCQMTCDPKMLWPLVPRTDAYMLPLFQTLDMGINDKEYLRLMTTDRMTRHIGNVMSDEDRAEIEDLLESE